MARQLSPVRGLAALSAGASQVPWRRFASFNALGCVLWATAVTLIASLFVRHLDALADDLSLAGPIALGAIALTAAVLVWRRLRRNALRFVKRAEAQRATSNDDAEDPPNEASL